MPGPMKFTRGEVAEMLRDYRGYVEREVKARGGPGGTAYRQALRARAAVEAQTADLLGYDPIAEARERAQARQRAAGNAPRTLADLLHAGSLTPADVPPPEPDDELVIHFNPEPNGCVHAGREDVSAVEF